MKIKYFIISICFLALFFGMNGCKKDNKDVTGIALDKESVTLNVGINTNVIPYPIPWDAEVNGTFIWTSNDISVATVDDSGVITGVAAGATNVICYYDTFTATVAVTVEDAKK
jgi:uncharacterized protein YjdB